MLDENDFRRISEEFCKVIDDNLLPALDTMIDEKLDKKFDEKLAPIKADIKVLQTTVATLPTKDFVTEKIGELRGEMVLGFHKIDHRFDQFADTLHEKGVFTEDNVARINTARLYPKTAA